MAAALVVGQVLEMGVDLVAKSAQLIDAGARPDDVQFTNGGEGVYRAGFEALQKASTLSVSAGILYVSIFVAGLLVGHFFVFHAASLASILACSHD